MSWPPEPYETVYRRASQKEFEAMQHAPPGLVDGRHPLGIGRVSSKNKGISIDPTYKPKTYDTTNHSHLIEIQVKPGTKAKLKHNKEIHKKGPLYEIPEQQINWFNRRVIAVNTIDNIEEAIKKSNQSLETVTLHKDNIVLFCTQYEPHMKLQTSLLGALKQNNWKNITEYHVKPEMYFSLIKEATHHKREPKKILEDILLIKEPDYVIDGRGEVFPHTNNYWIETGTTNKIILTAEHKDSIIETLGRPAIYNGALKQYVDDEIFNPKNTIYNTLGYHEVDIKEVVKRYLK